MTKDEAIKKFKELNRERKTFKLKYQDINLKEAIKKEGWEVTATHEVALKFDEVKVYLIECIDNDGRRIIVSANTFGLDAFAAYV